jgi:hypothetical protein
LYNNDLGKAVTIVNAHSGVSAKRVGNAIIININGTFDGGSIGTIEESARPSANTSITIYQASDHKPAICVILTNGTMTIAHTDGTTMTNRFCYGSGCYFI